MRRVVSRELRAKGKRRVTSARRIASKSAPAGFGGMLAKLGSASAELERSRRRHGR